MLKNNWLQQLQKMFRTLIAVNYKAVTGGALHRDNRKVCFTMCFVCGDILLPTELFQLSHNVNLALCCQSLHAKALQANVSDVCLQCTHSGVIYI